VSAEPETFSADARYRSLAEGLPCLRQQPQAYELDTYAPYRIWGREISGIEQTAPRQMERSARLLIAVRSALMPSVHRGYNLPIGGILTAHSAVVPCVAGVDIACCMRLITFESPLHPLEQRRERLRKALERHACLSARNAWAVRRQHAVININML
jgi:RNA-splicing ligase RtcB